MNLIVDFAPAYLLLCSFWLGSFPIENFSNQRSLISVRYSLIFKPIGCHSISHLLALLVWFD